MEEKENIINKFPDKASAMKARLSAWETNLHYNSLKESGLLQEETWYSHYFPNKWNPSLVAGIASGIGSAGVGSAGV